MKINQRQILLIICSVLIFGCIPAAPIKKKPHPKPSPPKAAYIPPKDCKDIVVWSDLNKGIKPDASRQKAKLTVTEVLVHKLLSELVIQVKTQESLSSYFQFTNPQGFKNGNAILDLYFDKDVVEQWGIPSAWDNDRTTSDPKADFSVRIKLGHLVIPSLGGNPVERVGEVSVDAVRNQIIDSVVTYELKRYDQGKWTSIPSPQTDSATKKPSYRSFADWEDHRLRIRIPLKYLHAENAASVILHGKIPFRPKAPPLVHQCLKLN